ncbi:hypothetical protein HH310_19765 [Actinoplanes sp. TBRC 11911]|nr:hypothetical protein [Actinoplanes sp. TBRC 11911]
MAAIDVITTALAAGAGAGLKGTASDVIRDAYATLKSLIKHHFKDDDAAAKAIEADEIEPGVWRARIGGALTLSGAVDDQELLTAARQLLAAADPATARTFNIEVGTNHGAIGEFHAPVTFSQAPPVPPAGPAAN